MLYNELAWFQNIPTYSFYYAPTKEFMYVLK